MVTACPGASMNIDVDNGLREFTVWPESRHLATWTDHQRTTDALASAPRTAGNLADIARSCNPQPKFFCDGLIIIEPKLSVRLFLVVVISRHSPGRRG